ncbi:MAG: alpha/beta fold hydrolase [Desulfarculus sp.]|nr:alpha/beta fold hydrolase [Desulfarculus sp.]
MPLNVVLLPFAGGHSYSYRLLVEALPAGLRALTPELPGRGMRISLPHLTNLADMADDLARELAPELNGPWLLFGHSMGGLTALLLARRLRALGLRPPEHLVVSGVEGPSIYGGKKQRHRLPREEFRQEIRALGGSPPEILDDDEFFRFFEPILRADFQALETFAYQPEPPLDLGISVLLGQDDDVALERARVWQVETTRPLEVRVWPGNHFFIFSQAQALGRFLAEKAGL